MEVFVYDAFLRSHSLNVPFDATVRDLIRVFSGEQGVPSCDLYVKTNGRLCGRDDRLQRGTLYRLEPRLCGGKGGFGSMLRALGAQIEKTTNREACRDLSGRRLRDVNHEKEMADWLKKQVDREAEREQRRLEKLQRKLAEPKHLFTDTDYEQQCHELAERLEDSVLKGMQASCSGDIKADEEPSRKRPSASKEQVTKKRKLLWTGLDELEDMSSSEDDSDASVASAEEGPAAQKTSTIGQNKKPTASSTSSGSLSNSPQITQKEPTKEEPEPSVTTEILEAQSEPDSSNVGTQEETAIKAATTNPDSACSSQPQKAPLQPSHDSPLDLEAFNSSTELEALGLEKLKAELTRLGMKCGGTLQERAARLFSVRGLSRDEIDPSLLAKPMKGKKK
ncbi:protein SDE2-like [Scleropages formosus]|uniref:Replication stress response regulator SDE2 n=1 Tax=Scleropages formosus TaxID=113540 RepID=A0A0P7TPH1_SCLFO|nr:protein SDE2-like [Scleropages formosus]